MGLLLLIDFFLGGRVYPGLCTPVCFGSDTREKCRNHCCRSADAEQRDATAGETKRDTCTARGREKLKRRLLEENIKLRRLSVKLKEFVNYRVETVAPGDTLQCA